MTYTPHRSAPARHVPSLPDTRDADGLPWRARLWIVGGVVASAALVTFGVWAVATAPDTVVVTETAPGSSPVGDFAFDVTRVRCGVSTVGPEGLRQRAAGQFCLLHLKVTNNGGEPELFDSGAQRIHDAKGGAYAVAEGAAVFLNNGNPTLLNEIEPGETVAGVLPFDMPVGTRPARAVLRDGMSAPGQRLNLPDPR